MTWVAGVDGCRAGWFRVCRNARNGALRFDLLESVAAISETDPWPGIVAIDMPIGLPEAGPRQCDQEARRCLGPRRASVFPSPIRPALAGQTRAEADAITRRIDGRGVAAQSFGIYAKVAEVDAHLQSARAPRATFYEVHPELSFQTWQGGQPMVESKKTEGGQRARLDLVEAWLGADLLGRARGGHPKTHLADDDVLDAVATLWTAHRIASGAAQTLPDSPPMDETGLPMRIVF